jgi:ribosomal protein L37AE/L43A
MQCEICKKVEAKEKFHGINICTKCLNKEKKAIEHDKKSAELWEL